MRQKIQLSFGVFWGSGFTNQGEKNMKRLILTFLVLVSFASFANAQHIGPATPAVNISGGVASPNVGVGYSYIKSEWDVDDVKFGNTDIDVNFGDVEFEQNQAYAHIGAVFGDESTPNYEVFARIGVADFEDDDGDFDGDAEMIFAVGMRNEFYQGQVFGIGGVLQASYIDSFSDDTSVNIGGEAFRLRTSFDDMFDVELGLPVQAKTNNAVFYAGPVVYYSTADVEFKVSNGLASTTIDADMDENRNVGVYGGLAWRSGNMSFEVEGKYKSDFSVGGFVSVVF
jgi:hypothetical protein